MSEELSPLSATIVAVNPIVECDGTEITTNLFKHFGEEKEQKGETLSTYLRIRPQPTDRPTDRPTDTHNCFYIQDECTLKAIAPKTSNAHKNAIHNEQKFQKFTFSRIFDGNVDQKSIYDSIALPTVRRFVRGENALLFAYGITSSGKSYTMRGTQSEAGIITRALNTIFELIDNRDEQMLFKPNRFCEVLALNENEQQLEQELRSFIFNFTEKSFNSSITSFRSQISNIANSNTNLDEPSVVSPSVKYSVWVSFAEIYNERLYDLLDIEISGEKSRSLCLAQDFNQDYYIKGLRRINVKSAEEAYKVLLFGQNQLSKHISSTDLNQNSSRSHSSFTISLVKYDSNTLNQSPPHVNNLSLCDLAGAERSNKANNTGDRIKEAGKINGSLLSLSRCIATLRHNQLNENKRVINFRDSKLTKLLQPYLSGNSLATMISTMNPSANLFDETVFALKFTAIASQLVVNTEEQRNRFQDSLRRLTQIWMQSSQRWSNFAHLMVPKHSFISNSISAIHMPETIKEEEDDNECEQINYEEVKKNINELSLMDFSNVDPNELELLRSQIDFLTDKLKQSENEKFEMEVQIRAQVVTDFRRLKSDMEKLAVDKDKAKKRLEEMMDDRLRTQQNLHKQEIVKLKEKNTELENELFSIREQHFKECELLNATIARHVNQISELTEENGQLNIKCESLNEQNEKRLNEINDLKQKITQLNQINIDLKSLEYENKNTSVSDLILFDVKQTSINLSTDDKCIQTSFVSSYNKSTTTIDLLINDVLNKSTNMSLTYEDKNTSAHNFEPLVTDVITRNDAITSPFVIQKCDRSVSPNSQFDNEYVTKSEMQRVRQSYEKQLKEKEAIINFNRELVEERDQELRKFKEKEEQRNTLPQNDKNIDELFKQLRAGKAISSLSLASSICSASQLNDENDEASTVLGEKQNISKAVKQIKFSSRKTKKFNSSVEKRYITSCTDVIDEIPASQGSESSGLTNKDEIGSEIFSMKKKIKKKRSANIDDEEISLGTRSKRKKPPIKNYSLSPISPLPSENKRVTRSRARRALQY